MMLSYSASPLFQRILRRSPFSHDELRILIISAPRRYKVHQIEKRKGGYRTIAQPTKELKFLQRDIIENELFNLPIHPAACAYVKGKSIYNHAAPHAKNKFLLKIDFKDFFPSITQIDTEKHLKSFTNFLDPEIFILNNILLRREEITSQTLKLSIGSPSSPFLSNSILYNFDSILSQYCTARAQKYTRYADDIGISSNTPHSLDETLIYISQLINLLDYPRLALNTKKTVNVSKKNNRTLTGLILSNSGGASIGRNKKRLIRSKIEYVLSGKESTSSVESIIGEIAFSASIDPSFVLSIACRHGFDSVADLISSLKEAKRNFTPPDSNIN